MSYDEILQLQNCREYLIKVTEGAKYFYNDILKPLGEAAKTVAQTANEIHLAVQATQKLCQWVKSAFTWLWNTIKSLFSYTDDSEEQKKIEVEKHLINDIHSYTCKNFISKDCLTSIFGMWMSYFSNNQTYAEYSTATKIKDDAIKTLDNNLLTLKNR